MSPDITVFAAQHLLLVDGVLCVVVVAALLFRRHHAGVLCWFNTVTIMTVTSLAAFYIADALIIDPRPFVVRHFQPLLAHTDNNGFPSGYALLAAVIASSVFFAYRKWSIPFVLLALIIDWARVGVGIHHVADIAGSWAIVLLASCFAFIAGPVLTAIVLPSIPTWVTGEQMRRRGRPVLGREKHVTGQEN